MKLSLLKLLTIFISDLQGYTLSAIAHRSQRFMIPPRSVPEVARPLIIVPQTLRFQRPEVKKQKKDLNYRLRNFIQNLKRRTKKTY